MSRTFRVLLAFVVALGACAGWAAAQIPSTDGVFYACVRIDRDQDEGRLARLVDVDERCRRNELRIHWSVVGPQGPQGEKGETGEPGSSSASGGTLHLVDFTNTDFGPYTNGGIDVPRPGHDGQWLHVPVPKTNVSDVVQSGYVFKTACPANGLHDTSERYSFGGSVLPLNMLISQAGLESGTLFYNGDTSETFAYLSVENPSNQTFVCQNVSVGGPAPRQKIETAPAPVIVFPVKLVLK